MRSIRVYEEIEAARAGITDPPCYLRHIRVYIHINKDFTNACNDAMQLNVIIVVTNITVALEISVK